MAEFPKFPFPSEAEREKMAQALPPLPEPDGAATVVTGHQQVGTMLADITREDDAWSRGLVEAWGAECARLATEAERERCAKVCEARAETWGNPSVETESAWCYWEEEAQNCAAEIRMGRLTAETSAVTVRATS